MGKLPIKRVRVLAQAAREGEMAAELKMHKKKPLSESFKEHIGKMIDNFKLDPLELMATAGITLVVHQTILSTESLLTQVVGATEAGILQSPIGGLLGSLWAATGATNPTTQDVKPLDFGGDNILLWVLSFAIAFIIVRHAGALIGLLEGGLTKIIPFLLGVAGA